MSTFSLSHFLSLTNFFLTLSLAHLCGLSVWSQLKEFSGQSWATVAPEARGRRRVTVDSSKVIKKCHILSSFRSLLKRNPKRPFTFLPPNQPYVFWRNYFNTPEVQVNKFDLSSHNYALLDFESIISSLSAKMKSLSIAAEDPTWDRGTTSS